MPDDENLIETDVVRIVPDLSGFRRKLEADLKRQLAGVNAKIPVDLESIKNKGAAARAAVQAATEEHAAALQSAADMRRRADLERTGLKSTARYYDERRKAAEAAAKEENDDVIQSARNLARRADLERAGAKATAKAESDRTKAIEDAAQANRDAGVASARELTRRADLAKQAEDAERKRREAVTKTNFAIKKAVEDRQRAETAANVDQQRKDEKYLSFQQHVNSELEKIHRARAEDEITIREQTQLQQERIARAGNNLRTTVLSAVDRAEKAETAVVERETGKRTTAREKARKDFNTFRKGPPIINWGGAGIRPMNALIGAVVALSPALVAMGANALQASTALTALGSAGIGAALGVGGLVVAFQGLGDVLSLRQQVKNEALTKAANPATQAKDVNQIADALGDYRTALREERRAEQAIHAARVEAARDLDTLRQKVRDLNNEYRSNQLSVREAEEAERATNRNFFSTATERLRAHQDTMDARTRLGDTRLERRQAQQDLRESIKKGVSNADKVIQAQDAYTDAKRRRQQSGHALANARSGADAAAVGKTTSAAAQLEQKLKDMAPAARDIYRWFVANEETLKATQRSIAQRVLPGFHEFLKQISKPAHGKTTIQVFADAMGEMGGLAGKYTALLGAFTRSPLFRSSFAKIQANNAKGFDILGAAGLKALRPLTRILAAASPLFPKMALGLSSIIDTFDRTIARADKDGSLGKWFEDAYESGRKWMSIGGNLLRLLKQIFNLSLPTGTSLVDKLVAFTDSLADWSEGAKGQRQIREFFEFFRDLPYEKIKNFVLQAAQMFAAYRAVQWAKANPFFTALGLIATSHPDLAIQLMSDIAKMAHTVAGLIAAHPEMTAFLLAAYSGNKARKALGLTMSIPGLSKIKDLLTSKFKVLDKVFGGGATTGTMTVHAGVVNVYGKALGGGVPGGGAKPGRFANAGAVGGGLTIAAALAAIFGQQQYGRAKKGEGFLQPFEDFRKDPGLATALKTLQMASPVGWAAYGLGKADVGKLITSLNRLTESVNPLAPMWDRFFNKGKEDYAFNRLKNDANKYAGEYHRDDDPAVANRSQLKEYITARKAAVDAAVENARATKGEAEAERVRAFETQRSVDTLKTMLNLYGWSKTKADAYSRAIFDMNAINEKQRLSGLAARDAMELMRIKLGEAGKKASTATAEMAILASKLDELDGTRTITVTINGDAVTFRKLETALIYQRLLTTGEQANQGNIAKHRAALRKNSAPPVRRNGQWVEAGMAGGGKVRGFSPNKRADNIQALLTAEEFVQPVDAVKHYGVGFMEAVRRKEFPRFADGGQAWPFKVAWPPHMDTAVTAPTLAPGGKGLTGITGAGGGSQGALVQFGRLLQSLGYTVSENPAFGGVHAVHVRGSQHYRGNAIDVNRGAGTSAREQNYLRKIIPEAHRRGFRTIFMTSGHYNHAHIDLGPGHRDGGMVRKFDNGGQLPPGFTMAYNGTGQNETVRTAQQEKALTANARIDGRDITRLAAALAGNGITMDGRKVAETTNRYNYVPAGV